MGKKTLTNAHCLLELVERVPAQSSSCSPACPSAWDCSAGLIGRSPTRG
jgi:hypothetical protein